MTRHQLIKLAAGRRILVLEAHGPLWHRLAQLSDDLIVNGRERFARAGKESHYRRKAMVERLGARRSHREWLDCARQPIVATSLQSLPANRPELVRKMLLEERDLGLHGEDDVRQARLDAAIRRDAREHPGAALLVHQAARAVERIDEQPPATITLTRTVR